MKKIISFLVVVAPLVGLGGISIAFLSCQDSTTSDDIPRNELVLQAEKSPLSKYSELGEFHNEGLRYILLHLKAHKSKIKERNDVIDFVQDGFENFLRQKEIPVTSEYMKFVRDLSRIESYKPKGRRQQPSLADSILSNVNFSQIERRYMQKLIDLSRARLSHGSLGDSVEVLAKRAYSELGPDESQRVLLSCSVLRSSYQYWVTEGENWLDFANSIKKARLSKAVDTGTWEPDWGSAAAADAIAAAAAAIPCIGATVGWGLCVGGAAVGASAADLTIQLLQYLFPN